MLLSRHTVMMPQAIKRDPSPTLVCCSCLPASVECQKNYESKASNFATKLASSGLHKSAVTVADKLCRTCTFATMQSMKAPRMQAVAAKKGTAQTMHSCAVCLSFLFRCSIILQHYNSIQDCRHHAAGISGCSTPFCPLQVCLQCAFVTMDGVMRHIHLVLHRAHMRWQAGLRAMQQPVEVNGGNDCLCTAFCGREVHLI